VGLNAHSIKQTKDFQSLDQGVRDLVIAVSQGRNTVAQLFVDHGQALRDHIDRRFKAQQQFEQSLSFFEMFSRQEEVSRAHKGTYRCWNTRSYGGILIFWLLLLEGYLEGFGRWKLYSTSGPQPYQPYEAKVTNSPIFNSRWIFHSLNREGFDKSDTKLHHKKDGNEYEVDDKQGGSVAEDSSATLRQPWSNFDDWPEHGKDIYWLTGKPSSGKSTLMK